MADDLQQRNSTYPLPAPPQPDTHPVVETRMPTVDPMEGKAAFGVAPSQGRRWPDTTYTGSAAAAPAAGEPPRPGPVRAVLGSQAPQAEGGMSYGEQMRNVGGWIADAVGGAAKTIVGAPGYGINRLVNGPTTSAGGAGAAAIAGPVPNVVTAPPLPTTPNAMDQRLSRGPAPSTAAAPPATPAVGPAAVGGVPGVVRFVDPSGRVLYTDQGAGAAPAPAAGPAAAVNTVQAGALPAGIDQRLAQATAAAAARGEPTGPALAAGGNLPALAGATIPGVNAPASQAVSELAARNQEFDRSNLINQLTRQGGRTALAAAARLQESHERNLIDATANTQREAGATERTQIQDTGQTTRERETNAARNAQEGPLRAAQTAEANAKTKAVAERQRLLTAHQAAIASGNEKAIQKAEDALRAHDQKWEKPEQFKAIAVPGGVDPATGLPTGSGVVVYNQSTGEVAKTMNSGDVKRGAPGAAPAALKAGTVTEGYRFKGGDPADRKNWEPAK